MPTAAAVKYVDLFYRFPKKLLQQWKQNRLGKEKRPVIDTWWVPKSGLIVLSGDFLCSLHDYIHFTKCLGSQFPNSKLDFGPKYDCAPIFGSIGRCLVAHKNPGCRVQYRIKHFHFKLSKTFCSFSPGHIVHSYWVRCGVVMIWCLLENFHFPDREKKWWVKSIINSKWKKWSSISWAGLERQDS